MKLRRTPEAIAARLTPADIAYAYRDKLAVAALRRSADADDRAFAHLIEMEARHA